MAEPLENYLEEISARIGKRADEGHVDELLLEIRAHHAAALELFANEPDPEAAALNLMGSARSIANRYVDENLRGRSKLALALVLTIAAIFYLQPLVYLQGNRADYLASTPLIWINVAACFVAASAWYRRSAFLPLLTCLMMLGAGLTIWLAPSFVWAQEYGGDDFALIPHRSAVYAVSSTGYYANRREIRARLREDLRGFAKAIGMARAPSDLVNVDYSPKTDSGYMLPGIFVLDNPNRLRFTEDFDAAKASWLKWRDVLPAMAAYEAKEDQRAVDLRAAIANGAWASWFPLACRAYGWSAVALGILAILNVAGCWLAHFIEKLDRLRPGVA